MKFNEVYNINPHALADNANYFLSIYHDLKVMEGKLNSRLVIDPKSRGHFYIGLSSLKHEKREF